MDRSDTGGGDEGYEGAVADGGDKRGWLRRSGTMDGMRETFLVVAQVLGAEMWDEG